MRKKVITQTSTGKNALVKTHLTTYKEKPQHGAYVRMFNESGADKKLSMAWLNKSFLDPHTESYICGAAAQ